jgi:5-methylcytosine-specific restriction endonuclease McrA
VLLKALRAACAELAGDPRGDVVSAETPPADTPVPAGVPAVRTSSDLADGLVAVAESFLAGKVAGADDAEVYQVVVHAGTDALAQAPAPAAEASGVSATPPQAGVSAETPARVPGDPADPARCHVEDGPAVSISTAQLLGCTAALSWMAHGRDGAVLALGRRRRRPSAAIRRAARERDGGRCRFPGCESRRVDLHHIVHWINGGCTDLDNLVSLCPGHHKLVHDRGYFITAPPPGGGGTFAFCRPDGTRLPSSPSLPEPNGPIGQAHDADITPDTIIPPWYGERLDLDYAIWVCFANARTAQEEQQHHAGPADRRADITVYEPEDCDELIRRYLERAPRRTGPTLIPIQV